MDRALEIFRTILPVALTLGLGALCRKKRLVTRDGLEALKTVAVQIGLPAVLLHTFAVTEYSLMALVIPLVMFAVCAAAWALGKSAGRALGLRSRFVPFLTTGFEAGMLGYALFTLLYGPGRVAEFARIDLGQVLFVFTLYKVLLGMDEGQRPPAGKIIRDMAASPIIWAILTGVLLGATGLYRALVPSGIAGVLDACTDFISAPVSALILLTVGYDLELRAVNWRDALAAVGLRLAILAALGGAVLLLFSALWPQADLTRPVCLMFLLPPPFVLPLFAKDEGQRAYLSSVLSVSTLAAMLGFAALAIIGA